MKKLTLWGIAMALATGLTISASAQKPVRFLGPPEKAPDQGQPAPAKKKSKAKHSTKKTSNQPGPQSGQASGFGVGRPGTPQPGTPSPTPLVNPPDLIMPAEGPPPDEPQSKPKPKPVKKPLASGAEIDGPMGLPAKKTDPGSVVAKSAKHKVKNHKAAHARRKTPPLHKKG